MQFTPYLNFKGQCKEAFEFYEQCLGGKIEHLSTFGETPAAEHVPAECRDWIMHVRLNVGNGVLMGSDSPPEMFQPMQGVHVSLHPTSIEEAERLFAALAEGGAVLMPLAETFWADRFGMVTDRFGTPWMINCETPAAAG